MHLPATPVSTCSSRSPENADTRGFATSPLMEARTLPSLTRWFDQCGHQRSISLPTPVAARSPRPWQTQDLKTPYVALSPPTPPTHFQSSFANLRGGLGLAADYGRHRASSYSSAQTTSPRLLGPSPMLSPDVSSAWRPRATSFSSVSSTESRAGLSPPHTRTSPICSNTSVASSDRCSVHSLLNHEDGT